MDTVTCPHCAKNVVPRLWHYRSQIPLRYMKTQHICPLCGVCMYVTDGEMTTSGKVLLLVMAMPFIVLIDKFSRYGNLAAWTFMLVVFLLVGKWFASVVRKTWPYLQRTVSLLKNAATFLKRSK